MLVLPTLPLPPARLSQAPRATAAVNSPPPPRLSPRTERRRVARPSTLRMPLRQCRALKATGVANTLRLPRDPHRRMLDQQATRPRPPLLPQSRARKETAVANSQRLLLEPPQAERRSTLPTQPLPFRELRATGAANSQRPHLPSRFRPMLAPTAQLQRARHLSRALKPTKAESCRPLAPPSAPAGSP
ncbi:uncharacterized protein BKA78DRAFT_316158 [Phyllosticta capitalensis]|uniref:uncharacterized protein n=1 Tax=Phyllosticta capitalensis TaxID=121624 RepID=UPI00312EB5F5